MKQKLMAILLAVMMIVGLMPQAGPVFAASEYGFQPVHPEGAKLSSLKLLDPSDITVESEDDEVIVNRINTLVDGTKNIEISFIMDSGMNNFNEAGFKTNNMPKIKVLDSNDNAVIQYDNGFGDLKFLRAIKSDTEVGGQGNPITTALFIGFDAGILPSGDYTLVFDKNICGNNTSKILGKELQFKFKLNSAAKLDVLVEEARAFLTEAPKGEEPGKYPQVGADQLKTEIDTAEAALTDINEQLSAGTITPEEAERQMNAAAEKLAAALKAFKASRIVKITGIAISGIGSELQVGDCGTASANVTAAPDEEQYRKVTWSASDNIKINAATGEWMAMSAGEGWIRATSKTDDSVSVPWPVTVRNAEGFLNVVLTKPDTYVSDSSDSDTMAAIRDTAARSNMDLATVSGLKLFTSGDGALNIKSIAQIRTNMPGLKIFDFKNVDMELIGERAFADWKNLEQAVLPDTAKTLDAKTFYNCSGLKKVTIPVGMENIGSSAFAGCTSLDPVFTVMAANPPYFTTALQENLGRGDTFNGLPADADASVTTIRVPYGCAADFKAADGWGRYKIEEMEPKPLTVEYDRSGGLAAAAGAALTAEGWTHDQVTELTVNCTGDAKIERITDQLYLQSHFMGVRTLDLSGAVFADNNVNARTFMGRKNAREILLPDSITNVGRNAFDGCSNLEEIVIPSGADKVGEGAFNGCDRLKRIIVEAKTPPELTGDILPASFSGNILVPPGYVDTYRKADGWSNANIRDKIASQYSLSLSRSSMTLAPLSNGTLTASVKTYGSCGDTVYWTSSNSSVAAIDKTTGGSVTVKGLQSGTAVITAQDVTKNIKAVCKVTVRFPAPRVSSASAGYNKTKIAWSGVSGAAGYEIYRSTKKTSGYAKIRTLSAGYRSYYDTGCSTGTTYYYKVRPYKKDAKGTIYRGDYSSITAVKPVPSKVTGVKARRGGSKKIKVTWKKVSGASGYKVYRSTKKSSGYKTVKTYKNGRSVKYVTGKLKKGKRYYFKVKAYRRVKGKNIYGSYSSAVSYKVK